MTLIDPEKLKAELETRADEKGLKTPTARYAYMTGVLISYMQDMALSVDLETAHPYTKESLQRWLDDESPLLQAHQESELSRHRPDAE